MSTTDLINSEIRAFQHALRGGKPDTGKTLFFAISNFYPMEHELKAAQAAFEFLGKRFGVFATEALGFTACFSNGQAPYYAKLFTAFARAGMLTRETREWVFQRFLVSALLPKDFNSGFPGWSQLQKLNKDGKYATPQWVELQAGLVDYQDNYVFAKLPTMSCIDLRVVLLQRLVAARERKSLPITPEPFGEGLVEFVSECEKAEVIIVAPLAWAKEPAPIAASLEAIAPKKVVLWCDDDRELEEFDESNFQFSDSLCV